MVQTILFLLLLNTSACWGYGFRGCAQNYPETSMMWCFNRDIANLSDVIRMIPDNITTINLSKNKINVIPPGSFSQVLGLKNLDLSQNQLVSLKGGEFRGLDVLNCLNLTSNNISSIHSNAFEGLIRLQILLLPYNKLATISPGIFNYLPMIKKVDLSLNMLKSFSCEDSGCSSTLMHLDLFANNIQRVNVSCFPALEYIRLSNNSKLELQTDVFASNPRLKSLLLQRVKAEVLVRLSAETKRNLYWVAFSLFVEKSPLTVCDVLKGMDHLTGVEIDLKRSTLPTHNSSLLDCGAPPVVIIMDANFGNVANLSLGKGNTSRLYLINCGLQQISHITFDGYQGLKTLQLNQNKIIIQQDTFKHLTNLTFLSFDRSKMRDIDPKWFVPLKKLTRLSLMKNDLTELTPNVFSALTKLEQLYLQFNLLKYITRKPFSKLQKLIKLNLSLNIIDFIEEGSFQDLTNLRYLDLSGNRIKRLTPRILLGLRNLRTFVLYNNRLHFRSYESPFTQLSSLQYLELNYQGPGGRGIGDIGPHFFEGPQQLISVSIGNSIRINFHPDAFVPLQNLTRLYIAGVLMKTTNLTAVFSPLKRLQKLTLYRADLDALPTNLLPPDNTLEILKVQSNHLHTVDKTMLDGLPRLRSLEITDNPLTCTCDNAWFKNWAIHNTDTQVSYLYDLQCDNDRRSPYLWQFDDKACSYEVASFTLFIICSVMNVLFVCLCLAWHTQGPTMRYLLLILKAKLRGRRGAAGPKFQYDAFISYSSKDEAWVMRQLVPNLERPATDARGLRLCLHHRDFRPGAAVLENIEAAIYSSRHTICVVTRHFLCSEWCAMEFQLASLRLLCDGSDVLLLVFLEEIPEHCLSPYTRLRKIVRKKTYMLWPEEPQEQDAFWVRLIDVLKDSKEEEKEARGGEDELLRLIGLLVQLLQPEQKHKLSPYKPNRCHHFVCKHRESSYN
ncbi:toll-like receptor 13 [Lates calcarifer]|uniref:Toll-like receptor 13 n=2 Tax=Lates calcarifer TaxID=8187 RepID=A0AAJ8AZU8_LATCA|nr:toll-like receptor 13 [Lates calcarifer]XP_050923346.1 toll-like receptor 13 [Lates calcarifer]